MCSFSFVFFEIWAIPTILILSFIFFFLRSLLLLGDYFSANPFFEKKRFKYNSQFTSFSNKITPILLFVYIISIFKNSWNNGLSQSVELFNFLPITFLAVYFFLKISESIFLQVTKNQQNQNLNSSGLFLIVLIPVATAMTLASNLIELLLPLELLGILFYFIFLEFTYHTQLDLNSTKNKTNKVMRGLLYYFWLSFVGSAFFVTAILLSTTVFNSFEFKYINYLGLSINFLNFTQIFFNLLIFFGLTLKMGGFFFFFFKADLYKLLPLYAVILFSIYSSIFYLLLLFTLSIKIPYFLYCCKWVISFAAVAVTTVLLLFSGFNIKNIYVFTGISSVLTICFCLLILV